MSQHATTICHAVAGNPTVQIKRCENKLMPGLKYCEQHQKMYLESYHRYKQISDEVFKYPIMAIDHKIDIKDISTQEFYQSTLKSLIPKLRDTIDMRKKHAVQFFSFHTDAEDTHNKIVLRFEVIYKLSLKYYEKWKTLEIQTRVTPTAPQAPIDVKFPYQLPTRAEQEIQRKLKNEEILKKAKQRRILLNECLLKKSMEHNKLIKDKQKEERNIGEQARNIIDLSQYEDYEVQVPCTQNLIYNHHGISTLSVSSLLSEELIKCIIKFCQFYRSDLSHKYTNEDTLKIFNACVSLVYNEELNFMLMNDVPHLFDKIIKYTEQINDNIKRIIDLSNKEEIPNKMSRDLFHYIVYKSLLRYLGESAIFICSIGGYPNTAAKTNCRRKRQIKKHMRSVRDDNADLVLICDIEHIKKRTLDEDLKVSNEDFENFKAKKEEYLAKHKIPSNIDEKTVGYYTARDNITGLSFSNMDNTEFNIIFSDDLIATITNGIIPILKSIKQNFHLNNDRLLELFGRAIGYKRFLIKGERAAIEDKSFKMTFEVLYTNFFIPYLQIGGVFNLISEALHYHEIELISYWLTKIILDIRLPD
jgi:hypothetical protein